MYILVDYKSAGVITTIRNCLIAASDTTVCRNPWLQSGCLSVQSHCHRCVRSVTVISGRDELMCTHTLSHIPGVGVARCWSLPCVHVQVLWSFICGRGSMLTSFMGKGVISRAALSLCHLLHYVDVTNAPEVSLYARQCLHVHMYTTVRIHVSYHCYTIM